MAREITPENQKRIDVILSGQEALVGIVTPNLRAVDATWDEQRIAISFMYDGPFTREDEQDSRRVVAKIKQDFPEYFVEANCFRIDYPNDFPVRSDKNQTYLYVRKEQ